MSSISSRWTQVRVHTWIRSGTRVLTLIASTVIAAMLISLAAIWAFIAPASAEFIGDGHYVHGVGAQNAHGFWLGALGTASNLGNGEESYCVSMWDHSPAMATPAQSVVIREPSIAAPEGLKLSAPQMAYLLQTTSAQGSADSRAALAFLAHMNFEQPSGAYTPEQSAAMLHARVVEEKPHIEHLARQYVAQAQMDTPVSYEGGVMATRGFSGAVNGVGVRSSAGWVAGISYSIELDGPAVFSEGLLKRLEGVTGNEPLNFDWQATGYGQLKARVTFHQVPRQTLTLASVGEGYQRLVTIAARPEDDKAEQQLETRIVPVYTQFQPQAKTDVGESRIVDETQSGATVSDTVEVFLANEGQTWPTVAGKPAEVTFRGTAYAMERPLEKALNEIPTDATEVGSVNIIAQGPGVYHAQLHGIKNGFITWVWRMEKNDPAHAVITDAGIPLSDFITEDWRDEYGQELETTSVRHRMSIDSAVSIRQTRSGNYFVDDIFVYGMPKDHGEFLGSAQFIADVPTLKQTLYFFAHGLEVTPENLTQARMIASIDLPAISGFHPSVGANEFKALEGNPAGTYVFVTTFPGDGRVAPYQSDVTDQHEWVVVEHPQEPPSPSPDMPPSAESPQSTPGDRTPPNPQPPMDSQPPGPSQPSVNPKTTLVPSNHDVSASPDSATQPLQLEPESSMLPRPLAQTGALAVAVTGGAAWGLSTLGVGMLLLRRRKRAYGQ